MNYAPLTYRPPEAAKALNIGKTKLFELIKSGDLRAVRLGKITLIPADSITELLNKLPQAQLPAKAA